MARIEVFRHVENGRRYAQGELIFREGEPGDVMYAVLEGEIEIRVGDRVIERTCDGGVIGELALIDRGRAARRPLRPPRACSRRSTRSSSSSWSSRRPFFALQVMRVLTERLRRQT